MPAEVQKPNITWRGSPNFWPGREGNQVLAIIDHIMQGTEESSDGWFKNVNSQVSAHFGVAKDGRIWQWVALGDSAWANGIEEQEDKTIPWIAWADANGVNLNRVTISIEHEGNTGEPMPEAQYQATLALHRWLLATYNIPADRNHINGHYQIAAKSRPNCPGIGFPWARLMADLATDKVSSTGAESPTPAPAPQPPVIFIPETGKSIGFGFKTFWQSLDKLGDNYRLLILGLPVTNEFDMVFSADPGKKRTVQLFERGGLIYEAENSAPWDNHPMTVPQLLEAYRYAIGSNLIFADSRTAFLQWQDSLALNQAAFAEVIQSSLETWATAGITPDQLKQLDAMMAAWRAGKSYEDWRASAK